MLYGKAISMLYKPAWGKLFRRKMKIKAIISIENKTFLEVTLNCLLLSGYRNKGI